MYIHNLVDLGMDIADPQVREIPFIFNELQAYAMIFFMHTDGFARMVLGDGDTLVMGGGSTHTYDSSVKIPYLGPSEDHAFYYPADTVNTVSVIHTDISTTPDTDTTLVLSAGSDGYTIAYSGNTCTVTTIGAPALEDGDYLTIALNMTTTAILTTEVVTLVMPADFSIEDMDWAQSADEMHLAQSGYVPTIIVRYDDDIWKLETKGFIDRPSDWSDVYGWPETVTFHQQRILYGANTLRRQTIWGSEAGNFNGFTAGTGASDAFTFTLDSGTQNKIQWMLSSKTLHIGTLGDEWTVTGNNQAALTPENILAQRQTKNGSEAITPLLVGSTTLFIERHGRVINEFVYDYTYDNFKTSDLSVLSPHITEHYSITDWSYQKTPDSIIWAVRSDGILLGLTYQRQHKVVGWHRHITDGDFKAVTVIPGASREDEVWVVVKRTLGGVVGYFVEKLTEMFKGLEAVDGKFLDNHIVYDGAASSALSGFDIYANNSISIIADGTVHADVVVNTSGEIELDNE
ncbi:MAG: hypothetical protein DRR06_20600, partial [Gammaproteobacteria bacterium]